MRPSRHIGSCLILGFALAARPLAAQERDDSQWLRHCQKDYDNELERFCEVRHTGFRPTGSGLTIDPDQNGGVEVQGWDRDSVAVTVRIEANARSEDAAKDLARGVKLEMSGSSISVSGPSSGRRENWSASLVVMVPRKTGLRAETVNGPLSVEDVEGAMELRAQNGPVALINLAGDVRARVQNGPLHVELRGSKWEGKGLDAESVNGPVDLGIPESYSAELETGTVNGPMSTSIPLTITVRGPMRDRIQTTLGKGGAPVRVVTTNGPITIRRARG
jgi:DUF4097 and DUF4098 domain-containing protein YvlB